MRAKRIQPIAKHADKKQEEAARAYAQSQQELAQAEKQLEQLLGYRDEYGRQLVSQSMNIEWLRDYQLFIVKINNAMEQAKTDIKNKQRNVEQKKLAWLKCRTRSKALNFVVEKYQHEEFVLQEKREQKETDEHGARVQGNKDNK
ncbi:MAG: flagellar export protein FliJ [Gammaproteobacteria bacterium]|jgi:flagellar protein FliJ|nr:flagellar export protein FliJ [Gammaproteobacteria bacterium]